jgi:hypothetical protein
MGMRTTNWSPRCEVVADGQGICSHVGAAFLAAPAGRLRLIAELAVAPAWGPRGVNNRGQVLRNPATLRHQPDLFGRICSTPTAWGVLAEEPPADPRGDAGAVVGAGQVEVAIPASPSQLGSPPWTKMAGPAAPCR